MLANGAELGVKKGESAEYKDLPGLQEIPEVDNTPEKVDITVLKDKVKKYDVGIGDAEELVYKFLYDNSKADCPYRILRAMEAAGEVGSFCETDADGTKIQFDAKVSVKRTGGGVNGVIQFDVTMALQSEITFVDPA